MLLSKFKGTAQSLGYFWSTLASGALQGIPIAQKPANCNTAYWKGLADIAWGPALRTNCFNRASISFLLAHSPFKD
jgi:hypothetical protein